MSIKYIIKYKTRDIKSQIDESDVNINDFIHLTNKVRPWSSSHRFGLTLRQYF